MAGGGYDREVDGVWQQISGFATCKQGAIWRSVKDLAGAPISLLFTEILCLFMG